MSRRRNRSSARPTRTLLLSFSSKNKAANFPSTREFGLEVALSRREKLLGNSRTQFKTPVHQSCWSKRSISPPPFPLFGRTQQPPSFFSANYDPFSIQLTPQHALSSLSYHPRFSSEVPHLWESRSQQVRPFLSSSTSRSFCFHRPTSLAKDGRSESSQLFRTAGRRVPRTYRKLCLVLWTSGGSIERERAPIGGTMTNSS